MIRLNSNKAVTLIDIATYADLTAIPKPLEIDDNSSLIVTNTVKNLRSDNIDVFLRVSATSIDAKLIFFYPNNVNGVWWVHPDHELSNLTSAFATNKGRKYARFLISDALVGCHFALWRQSGTLADVAQAEIVPCRRGGSLE